jgi:DNA-binding transcriptional regulator YhcF (GntR family)
MSIIQVKENSGVPKYKQIIASLEESIVNGEIKKGDKLPSINSIKFRFSLSRDTVLLAYNDLKVRGIIQSIPGKGYYIKRENIEVSQKIFLLFDELNAFKENLYKSFLKKLNPNIEVDIYFHHFNYDVFSKHIYDNIGNYNHYIIMPANLADTNLVIDKLPKDKVYILDQTHEELSKYQTIYQNFRKDIKSALNECLTKLVKYNKIVFIFNEDKQPKEMQDGFYDFCNEHQMANEIISDSENRELQKGEIYLIPEDRDLIQIIKKMKEQQLSIATDIGIISYNDTLLKEIVEGGITTISTDFNEMGEKLAEIIFNKEFSQIENTNHLIVRNSI